MAKLLLLLQLLLTFLVAAFAAPPPNNYHHPNGYTASWTMVKEGISVTVSTKKTKTSEWAAIGFMKEENPNVVDIVSGGYIKDKQSIIHGLLQDGKLQVEFTEPKLKPSVSRSGDNLVLKFTHPIKPSNPKDFTFTDKDCYTFVFFVNNKDFTVTKGYILPILSSAVKSSTICMKDLKKPGMTLTTLVTGETEPTMETPALIGDVIYKPNGEEGIPRGCKGKMCLYTVKWELIGNHDVARFTVMAKQKKDSYIGFGFSKEKNANEILAVYGYMTKSSKGVIVKGKILHGNTKPVLSDDSDLMKTHLTYVDSIFTLCFDIKLKTTGEDIVNLMNPYYYVLMVGGGPVVNEKELGPLGGKALHYSDKKISLVKDVTTLLPPHDITGGDVIFKPEGEEGVPHGCSEKTCLYKVKWELIENNQVAKFTVLAKQKKDTYVAFGFSLEKNTNEIIAVYGYLTESGQKFVKGKILHGNTKPVLSDDSNLSGTELTYTNGVFTLVFEIKLESSAEDIANLMNPYYYVLMVGGGPVVNENELGPLVKKVPQYTDKKISLVEGATSLSTPSMESPANIHGEGEYKPEGEEKRPPGCEEKECLYILKWKVNLDTEHLEIQVDAKQNKNTYTGVGFVEEKTGKIIHAVFAYHKKNGKYVVIKGLIHPGKPKPQLTDSNDLDDTNLIYHEGILTLTLKLKLKGTGANSLDLMTKAHFIVLLVGGGPVINDKEIDKLTKVDPEYTEEKISFVETAITLSTSSMESLVHSPITLSTSSMESLENSPITLSTPSMESPANIHGGCEFKPEGEEKRPHGCKGEKCLYMLKWKVNLETESIEFQVDAKQNKNTYTGVGFSLEKTGKIHVVYGYHMKSGKFVVIKGLILPGKPKPQLTDSNDLDDTNLIYNEGLLTLTFKLKLKGTGADSLDLMSEPHFIVLLVGGGPVIDDKNIDKLTKVHPEYTEEKISFVETEVPCGSGSSVHTLETGTQGTPISPVAVTPEGLDGDETETMGSTEISDVTDEPGERLAAPPLPKTKVRFCNFANWAQHYPEPVKFLPSDIDPKLCTHINYCFVWVKDGKLVPTENNDERDHGKRGLMQQINDLKTKSTGLKTILSVGGYDMDIRELTKMLKENRTDFIENAIHYLRRFNFDGINLMFKYPGWGASPPEDKGRFMSLVKEMKDSFVQESRNTDRRRLQLVVSVSVLPEIIARAYNVKELSNTVDIIQLLAYDLHGGWEKKAFHHSPIRASKNSGSLGMTTAVSTWTELGADKQKLIIGIPLYGRGGILSDPNKHTPGSSILRPSPKRKYTNQEGLLSYYEICPIVSNKHTQKFWIEDESVPYMVFNDTWVGYDNERSVHLKAKWVVDNELLGASTWITNFDDFKGTFCHHGKYPLIRTVSDTLLGKKGMVFGG